MHYQNQNFNSSTSSSTESISNIPLKYTPTYQELTESLNFLQLQGDDEPPGFSKYRLNAIYGTLGTLSCDKNGFQYIPQPRTSLGTEGKAINLKVNHFSIKMQSGFIYQYNVTIIPDKCPKNVNR